MSSNEPKMVVDRDEIVAWVKSQVVNRLEAGIEIDHGDEGMWTTHAIEYGPLLSKIGDIALPEAPAPARLREAMDTILRSMIGEMESQGKSTTDPSRREFCLSGACALTGLRAKLDDYVTWFDASPTPEPGERAVG